MSAYIVYLSMYSRTACIMYAVTLCPASWAACLICAPSSLGMRSVIASLLQIAPATRTISGEVYRIDYPTDTQDAPIVTIVTEDGNEWITDDYIAPRHTPLEITFSANSTEDVTDDEIISIASIWTR